MTARHASIHLVGGTVIRQHDVITSRPMVDCSRILTATRPKITRTHRRWCGFYLCCITLARTVVWILEPIYNLPAKTAVAWIAIEIDLLLHSCTTVILHDTLNTANLFLICLHRIDTFTRHVHRYHQENVCIRSKLRAHTVVYSV